MPSRAAAGVAIAGCVLLGVIGFWRSARIPPPPSARPTPPPAAPPVPLEPSTSEGFRSGQAEGLKSDVLVFVRDSLTRHPEDVAPLALLDTFPDALLEFAEPLWPKETRLHVLKRLEDLEWSESRIRKLALLFESEPDEELRVSMLLGVSKSSLPEAADLARRGLKDRESSVREIALTALNPEKDGDRRALIEVTASDSNEVVRGTAALQLSARSADPEVRVALIAMLLRDASEKTRALAITALKREAARGDPSVLDALRRCAGHDPSAEVQAAARAVLAGLPPGK